MVTTKTTQQSMIDHANRLIEYATNLPPETLTQSTIDALNVVKQDLNGRLSAKKLAVVHAKLALLTDCINRQLKRID